MIHSKDTKEEKFHEGENTPPYVITQHYAVIDKEHPMSLRLYPLFLRMKSALPRSNLYPDI